MAFLSSLWIVPDIKPARNRKSNGVLLLELQGPSGPWGIRSLDASPWQRLP